MHIYCILYQPSTSQVSELIAQKKDNCASEASLAALRRTSSSAPEPEPAAHSDPMSSASAVAIESCISPLAWHFDGVREGVQWTPPVDGTDNASLRRQLEGILSGIAAEKVCNDEDGRQLFGVLSQVHVAGDHIAEAADVLADTDWGDSDVLQTACEQDSVAFAVRAFVLVPPCRELLLRARSGDSFGVLEFVEVLLKEWQTHSEPATLLSPPYSEHP